MIKINYLFLYTYFYRHRNKKIKIKKCSTFTIELFCNNIYKGDHTKMLSWPHTHTHTPYVHTLQLKSEFKCTKL